MIEYTKAYVSDGVCFSTLEAAQTNELGRLLSDALGTNSSAYQPKDIAKVLLKERKRVVDILTTNANSRPRARAVNGGKRTRKTDATLPLPLQGESSKTEAEVF